LDENLCRCKPILESSTNNNVFHERYDAYFQPGEDDEIWLPFVGERAWVVLTKDKRNRYNQLEKTAIRRHKVAEFYFASGNMNGAEMAAALVIALPEIKRICNREELPFIGRITKAGTVLVVEDSKGSTHERRQQEKTKQAKKSS
jgi:PIN like domain